MRLRFQSLCAGVLLAVSGAVAAADPVELTDRLQLADGLFRRSLFDLAAREYAALAETPAPERVSRLHYLAQTDLAALYQGADLFVFPSKYEGFGLPVLEAMSAGVPVVTTREAAIPEVGGDAVAYAEAGNAEAFAAEIRRLLALDAPARAAVVAKAKARAAGFSWEATARATVAALEAL